MGSCLSSLALSIEFYKLFRHPQYCFRVLSTTCRKLLGQVKVGDRKISDLLFANEVTEMYSIPEGLQKQIDAATRFARKWRLLATVKHSPPTICNESKGAPVEFT